MPAYRKFSDALQSKMGAATPPKPPKAPKVDQFIAGALGGLGALGETELQIQNFAPAVAALDRPAAIWGEAEAERAAIVEYDGGAPRAWAEGFARLHPDRPPSDVPLRRWQTFVDDVGRFLDGPFLTVAVTLGWGPLDLFGCDRDRPFNRIDKAGLLWLLNGDRLVALSENTAAIERRTGSRYTYHRKQLESGRTLAWELAERSAAPRRSVTQG
jgi:hypothetical protein